MNEREAQISEDLTQLVELLNAKGDRGEINEIVERARDDNETVDPDPKR